MHRRLQACAGRRIGDPAPPSTRGRLVSFLASPVFLALPAGCRLSRGQRSSIRSYGGLRPRLPGPGLIGRSRPARERAVCLALVQREAHTRAPPHAALGHPPGRGARRGLHPERSRPGPRSHGSRVGAASAFREAMLEHGYRCGSRTATNCPWCTQRARELFVDVDVVHPFRDGWAITEATPSPAGSFATSSGTASSRELPRRDWGTSWRCSCLRSPRVSSPPCPATADSPAQGHFLYGPVTPKSKFPDLLLRLDAVDRIEDLPEKRDRLSAEHQPASI